MTSPRHGHPAAVPMNPDDREVAEETLDLLADPAALAEIRHAEQAIADGDAVTADQLRARYLRR